MRIKHWEQEICICKALHNMAHTGPVWSKITNFPDEHNSGLRQFLIAKLLIEKQNQSAQRIIFDLGLFWTTLNPYTKCPYYSVLYMQSVLIVQCFICKVSLLRTVLSCSAGHGATSMSVRHAPQGQARAQAHARSTPP